MKLRRLKAAAAVTAALILTTSTVGFAAGTDAAATPPAGNAAYAEQIAGAPLGKVANEKYTLTLEQAFTLVERVISAGDHAIDKRVAFVYSVEGNTDAAKAEVMAENFYGEYTAKLPANSGIDYEYRWSGEMKDLNTLTKKYFIGIIEVKENPQGLPLSFGLNAMTGDETYIRTPLNDEGTAFSLEKAVASGRDDLYITIPMDQAAKELNLTLPTASGHNAVVNLSPVDIYVEKPMAPGFENIYFYTDIFFRMEDGSVRSVNEFYFIGSSSRNDSYSDGSPIGRYSGEARRVLDLSKFKSIILGNQEYDLNDVTQVKEVQVPENLRPIAVKPVEVGETKLLPVKETVEKLGGQVTFDESAKSAVLQYRGITVEIREGEATCLKNGVPVLVYGGFAPVTIMDGAWMIDYYMIKSGLNVSYDFVWSDTGFVSDTSTMYLIP